MEPIALPKGLDFVGRGATKEQLSKIRGVASLSSQKLLIKVVG
jgi:hypothetical protein